MEAARAWGVPPSTLAGRVIAPGEPSWTQEDTDLAVAHDAGLPGLILHGTATLAHAVSVAVHAVGRGDPRAIRRVRGRFGAWVPMPSTLTVRLYRDDRFEVVTADGAPAVRDGHITFA